MACWLCAVSQALNSFNSEQELDRVGVDSRLYGATVFQAIPCVISSFPHNGLILQTKALKQKMPCAGEQA